MYLKPVDLHLSQDLPHHNQLTPDSAPYFSVYCVGVAGIWNSFYDRNKCLWNSLTALKSCDKKYPINHRFDICEKN